MHNDHLTAYALGLFSLYEDVLVGDWATSNLIAGKLCHHSVADSLEACLMRHSDRLGRLLRNLERINRRAILPDAVVEVRTCRCARRTYIADKLTLRHLCAHLDALGEAFEVEVACLKTARVLNLDGVTTAATPASEDYRTISNRVYGSARGCCIVDTMVWAIYLMYGV